MIMLPAHWRPTAALGHVCWRQLSSGLQSNIAERVHRQIGIFEEEADEAMFWMETLVEPNIVPEQLVNSLLKEANEILSIIVATIRTARSNLKK